MSKPYIILVLAIFVPKIIKFGKHLTKLWQKTILTVFSEWVSSFLTAHQHKIGHSVPYMVKIS